MKTILMSLSLLATILSNAAFADEAKVIHCKSVITDPRTKTQVKGHISIELGETPIAKVKTAPDQEVVESKKVTIGVIEKDDLQKDDLLMATIKTLKIDAEKVQEAQSFSIVSLGHFTQLYIIKGADSKELGRGGVFDARAIFTCEAGDDK